jgi:hypothetical protein
VEEAINFWELPYWKDLDVHHSIDVMHGEKNMCESLLGTLLNTDRKTRNHGHAQADLKKMGIRPELWLDDSIKGMELPTSCITLSKHEKEFCGFLKHVKVPSGYSMNISRLISFSDLKVAPGVKSHDYHVLLTQMTIVGIWNILLPVNVLEAIMNFCFFFNAIGHKVLSEEALKSLEKRHYETLYFLEMYFPPAFFDINVHFTTHLIKGIKLLGPVFLHQMYPYDRFNSIMKSFVRN